MQKKIIKTTESLETVYILILPKRIENIYLTIYFNEIKKAVLKIIYALLNMQIKQTDRDIKPVSIIDTS